MRANWRARPTLTGPVWRVCLLALGAGCSVYTDGLLLSGGGGAEPATGGSGQVKMDGGSPSGQSGADGRGAAPSTDGGAGASSPSGGGGDGGSLQVGGEGGTPAGGEGGDTGFDACPDDATKVEPGECGCGVPESCASLEAALAHRYDFETPGMVATDSVGGADGTIVGAAAADGKLAFDGTTVAYVDLPNGMISALTDASFEIWLEWQGGAIWQRIFDFGTSDKGEDKQGYNAPSYLALIPSDGRPGNTLCAVFTSAGLNAETRARAAEPLPTDSLQHLVVVVDDTKNELRLYLNGALAATTTSTESLSNLNDVNNWLGRSNYVDGPLNATIEEFRIYDVALDATLVAASHDFGPNPGFL